MTPLPDQKRIARERERDMTRGNGHLTQWWQAKNTTPDDFADFSHTGGRWHPVNRANVDRMRNRNMQPGPDGHPVDVNRSTEYTSLSGGTKPIPVKPSPVRPKPIPVKPSPIRPTPIPVKPSPKKKGLNDLRVI